MTIKRRTCINCDREVWYGYWPGPPSVFSGIEKHWFHTHSNNADCMLYAKPDRL